VSDPNRPANRRLATLTTALGAALALAIAGGVLTDPSAITGPPSLGDSTAIVDTLAAVHQWQCPDSTPEAIVVGVADLATIRVAGDTLSYRPAVLRPQAGRAPVVLCGPRTMVRQLLTHPEAGHGAPAILNPPDSTASTYRVPSLTIVNGRVIAPQDTVTLARTGLTTLIATALNVATPGTVDTAKRWMRLLVVDPADSMRAAFRSRATVLYYQPALGTRARSQLAENRGSCWGGDPDPACLGQPRRTPTTWLATYGALVPVSGVLHLTAVTVDTTTTAIASLSAGGTL
jgi:hypothetical protein